MSVTAGARKMTPRILAGLALCLAAAGEAAAHPWSLTEATVRIASDGRYEADFTFDVDALVAGVLPGHMTPENYANLRTLPADERARRLGELRDFFREEVEIAFDGAADAPSVFFPDLGERGAGEVAGPPASDLPGRTIRFVGRVPDGARHLTVRAPVAFGTLLLQIENARAPRPVRMTVDAGETSRRYALDAAAPAQGRLGVVLQYLVLGFEHILPKGLDHILFVLGLFLLSPRARALVKQVTAFTLAHSLTLALSIYGVVSLPPSVVEPLIALSIAFVAIENVFTAELRPWRTAVVFGFGLLHGLGFAGVLSELGLPRGEFVTALVGFNAGVELGQLAVIALALAAVGWFRGRTWYRARVVVPASCAIAAVGLYWAVQRTLGG
jgi:hypothetical protein